MTDKLWAQLVVPPILGLVWLLGSWRILNLAQPGGQLDKSRSKLNWYGFLVIVAVMYAVWFHSELSSYWKVWFAIFVLVAVVSALLGIVNHEEGRLLNLNWKRFLMFWIAANLGGVVIVSIFRYFGN